MKYSYFFTTVLISLFFKGVSCNPFQYFETYSRDYGDDESPLFLTSYIESGNIEKGRHLARVYLPTIPEIESYAGLFTVNKKFNSNHFLWYFPAMSHNPQAPVVLWLQGGPGDSSLYGLFDENGPIKIQNDTIARREYHWALDHHLIYIDNPVGTGFSFTDDKRGYCTDQTQIGEQLYNTMTQFFQLFPDLQKNDFYVTGESYAGKYVPALSYAIHKKNPSAKTKINLKGLAIGNGLCDPINQFSGNGEYLYQTGLIDWNLANYVKLNEEKLVKLINEEKWMEAQNVWIQISNKVDESTSMISRYNYLLLADTSVSDTDFGPIVENKYIRKAIHVGNLPFHSAKKVREYLQVDIMKSVVEWISELLNHYKLLFYSGQLDTAVAYPWTVNFLRNLDFSGSEVYKTAERYKWLVGDDLAGYVKQAGNLTEVLVRNAGHMVPKDQPVWALTLITWFTDGTALQVEDFKWNKFLI